MRFTPDFSDYKDTYGSLVPPGRYTVVIEDTEMGKSRANNDMLILTLRIRGGDYDGATVIDRLTDTTKAHFRIVNFLEALTGKPVPRKQITLETDSWLGRAVQIDTSEREWTDNAGRERTSMQIDGYTRAKATAETAEELDLDDVPEAPEPNGTAVEENAPLKAVDTDTEEIDLASLEL